MLGRTNARLADFEEVVPRGRASRSRARRCSRATPRGRLLRQLERDASTGSPSACGRLAEEAGLLDALPDKLGERELTRQADLARLVRLAAELDDGELTCAGFAAELRRRFDPGGRGARGVHLLTYHRAKGLEFDAVFLPRLEEKELPSKLARTDAEIAEERRLFYVGITRARRHLALTWSRNAEPVPRRAGHRAGGPAPASRARRRAREAARRAGRPRLYGALAEWRKQRAKSERAFPAYIVFHNAVLAAIADAKPRSIGELAAVAASARRSSSATARGARSRRRGVARSPRRRVPGRARRDRCRTGHLAAELGGATRLSITR